MTDEAKTEGGLKIGGEVRLLPLDVGRAGEWLADLRKASETAGLDELTRCLETGPQPDRDRLAAILDLSEHLRSIMLRRPEWLERLLRTDARERLDAVIGEAAAADTAASSQSDLMRRLRKAKAEASLLIGLRDLTGAASGAETTRDLSRLAEAAVSAALRFLLRDLHERSKIALPDIEAPERQCGLFILAMGKLGGGELNYSSDIDLIVFFDPDRPAITDKEESVEMFSRLVRSLLRIVGERTGDGYVFRTDLRLRPDPGAMPLAIPVETALGYYEASGRSWERAAYIKARPIAGDREAADAFLDEMTPFVWRKYLDFAAIADIEMMKDRIDRHRGFGAPALAGQNVKLGRGGIREVEFFAQTQQLIAGGREPRLRSRSTVEALGLLVGEGWLDPAAKTELVDAYWFLRGIEHRLQMVADEQTHVLPEDEGELLRIARMAGFKEVEALREAFLKQCGVVEAHYGTLFSKGRDKEKRKSAITLTAAEQEDPAVVEELSALGFERPADAGRIIGRWSVGRYRSTRTNAARDQLDHVLPALVRAISAGREPDAALAALDAFFAGLPGGLQLFSILATNPRILDLLALIVTSAPRLAETIARRPHVFDALIDPVFFEELPTRETLSERLSSFLGESGGYEDTLDRLRIFASEQKFLIGTRLLSGTVRGRTAGMAFSDLADVVLQAALDAVLSEFEERHGKVLGGRIAILGMGRLGSRELTAGSDLDLILLFDHDEDAEESDGEKPLAVSVYFARLTQRLIAALTSPMAEGVLYEVDFRLRPSGNKGPLATQFDAFRRYQEQGAWTWERMALTRARIVAGDAGFASEIEQSVREVLGKPRDLEALKADIVSMRARVEREKPPKGALDLKLRPGGAMDIEFVAQWAILSGKVALDKVGRPTVEVIAALEGEDGAGESLSSSMRLYNRVIQLTRLGPPSDRSVEALPNGLAERIAQALDQPDPSRIEPYLDDQASTVRAIFERLLGPDKPAEAN